MKVYIAGPFFNETERKRMNKLKSYLLNISGHEYFFPMDHFIKDGENISNYDWANAVFKMDVDALVKADRIIAVYDKHYSDSGTAWEIGFAYAHNIPITLLCTDLISDNSIMPIISAQVVYKFDEFISENTSLPIDKSRLNTLK